MTKKILLAAVALAMAFGPISGAVKADSGEWQNVTADAAWSYTDYRVERLAFDSDVTAPFSLGDLVFVADPADTCQPTLCERYDLFMLKNGMQVELSNVPDELLNAESFAKNEDRLVFVNQEGLDDNHFSVMEIDPTDGSISTLVDDVFFNGAEDVAVMVDGDDIYFNPSFNYNNSASYDQSGVYVWDPAEKEADIIGKHWELRDEDIFDAQDGIVFEKLTFEDDSRQLWLGDTHNVNNMGMTREAIVNTWTDASGDIVTGRFLEDGSLEYFMFYTRYTFDPDSDAAPVRHEGEYLSWYRDLADSYQLSGDRMAWINAEDTLYVSDEDGDVMTIGTATGGAFVLESDRVFYASGASSFVYDFDSGLRTSIPFVVTDASDETVVGVDEGGNIWSHNLETGKSIKLGFGVDPMISDDAHVYWKGTDGEIYEATILPAAAMTIEAVQAMKTSTSNVVYLIDGSEKRTIPSESVYWSWFDSWSDVQTVSQTTLNSYTLDGTASFAPGSLVKLTTDSKVYVVGEDGKLHWITTQTVAYTIYGSDWNAGIVDISLADFTNYAVGIQIQSEHDIETI